MDASTLDTSTKPTGKRRRVRIRGNLYMIVSAKGARSWECRVYGKTGRRDVGLGSYPEVGFDKAWRLAQSDDPAAARDAERASPNVPTFRQAVEREVARREKDEWLHSTNTLAQSLSWVRELAKHAAPLADMPVDQITKHDVRAVLEAAPSQVLRERVRSRASAVFKWAIANDYRIDDPADRAVLRRLTPLPKLKHENHAACPVERVGDVLAALGYSAGAAAARLATLTAVRASEAIGADWSEFDDKRRLWTIPAERMKASEPHHVPLSNAVVELLSDMAPAHDRRGRVFVGRSGNMHYNAVREALQTAASKIGVTAANGKPITAHGMRSAFADWAVDAGFDRADVLACLAHLHGTKSDRAYLRSPSFERRRAIMDAWAAYLSDTA